MKIKAHTSLIGNTGYNSHSRNFFTHLDKLIPIKVRNFTTGENWDGDSKSHDNEPYLTEQHKNMLVEQSLWENEELKEHLHFVIENSNLTEIERTTISYRFGLAGLEPKTLSEISALTGYTAMGIQKAEKRALSKLQKHQLVK